MSTWAVFGARETIVRVDRIFIASNALHHKINRIKVSRLVSKKMKKRAKCIWTRIDDIYIHYSDRCTRGCRKFHNYEIYPRDNYGLYTRDHTGKYIRRLRNMRQFIDLNVKYGYKLIKSGSHVITHQQSPKMKLITVRLLGLKLGIEYPLMLMCRREINQIVEKHSLFNLSEKILFKISQMVSMVFAKNLTKLLMYY